MTTDKLKELLEMEKRVMSFDQSSVTKHISDIHSYAGQVKPLVELLLKAEERLQLFNELDVVNENVTKADMERTKDVLAAIEAFRKGETNV